MSRSFVIAACAFTLLSLSSAKQQTESDNHRSETSHLESGVSLDGHESDGGKGGFSAGSGLRLIAQGSAEQASNAFLNQHLAARQAAFVAKSALAQAASAASATARTALVGKLILVDILQRQVQEAHEQLEAENKQLEQAQRAAASAQEAAQSAQSQMSTLGSAANAAQSTAAHAAETLNAVTSELGSQIAMVGAAKRRFSTLVEQLSSAGVDYEATQAAAQQASDSALIAQSNAAQAGEKASANSELASLEGHVQIASSGSDDDHGSYQ